MVSRLISSDLKHSLFLALIFQISWVIAVLISAMMGKNSNVGLLLLLMVVLWIPAVILLLTRTRLPDALQIHFYVFITLSSVMGSLFGLYALIPHWDTYVHIDSGVLLAWLGLFAVRHASESSKASIPRWFTLSVAVATSLAFGALWEISEFLSDTYLHTTTQANLEDSIVDMGAALIGAVIAVLIVIFWAVPKSVLPHSKDLLH